MLLHRYIVPAGLEVMYQAILLPQPTDYLGLSITTHNAFAVTLKWSGAICASVVLTRYGELKILGLRDLPKCDLCEAAQSLDLTHPKLLLGPMEERELLASTEAAFFFPMLYH